MALWQLGLALVVLGGLSSAVGLLLMKRSADLEAARPLRTRYRWMLGFLFLVVNATSAPRGAARAGRRAARPEGERRGLGV